VEDEVFEVNKFAVDTQRSAGIGEMGSLDPARADRRTGNALVETRQRDAGVKSRPHKAVMLIFARS